MNYTEGKCYLLQIQPPFERLEFQFIPQKAISWSRSLQTETIYVAGRNLPKFQQGGGEETISFSLDFFADETERKQVIQKVEWLRARTYHEGLNSRSQGKQIDRLKLVIGDMFKDEVWIITSLSAETDLFDRHDNYLPKRAAVNLTLSLAPDQDMYKRDILWRNRPFDPNVV